MIVPKPDDTAGLATMAGDEPTPAGPPAQ